MSHAPAIRRRCFQFSLRTMFAAVTLVALWLGWKWNWIHQRHAFSQARREKLLPIDYYGNDPDFIIYRMMETKSGPRKAIPSLLARLVLQLFREPAHSGLIFTYDADITDAAAQAADMSRIQKLFPESRITQYRCFKKPRSKPQAPAGFDGFQM